MSHKEGGRTKLVFFECCIGPGLARPPTPPSKLPRGLGGFLVLSCLLKSLLLPCLFNPPPIPPMPLPKISWSKLSLRYHKKMSLEWFPTGNHCRTQESNGNDNKERDRARTFKIKNNVSNNKTKTKKINHPRPPSYLINYAWVPSI